MIEPKIEISGALKTQFKNKSRFILIKIAPIKLKYTGDVTTVAIHGQSLTLACFNPYPTAKKQIGKYAYKKTNFVNASAWVSKFTTMLMIRPIISVISIVFFIYLLPFTFLKNFTTKSVVLQPVLYVFVLFVLNSAKILSV